MTTGYSNCQGNSTEISTNFDRGWNLKNKNICSTVVVITEIEFYLFCRAVVMIG